MRYIKSYRKIFEAESKAVFSPSELNKIGDEIDHMLTIFKDEGITYYLKPNILMDAITIELKISAYIYSDDTNIELFGKTWNPAIKEKMQKNCNNIQTLIDESENLFMKLEEIFNIQSIVLDDTGFKIVLTKKAN